MAAKSERHAMRPERQKLRSAFRARRRALTPRMQQQHALAIARWLSGSIHLLHAKRIGLYMANDGEVDVMPLAAELRLRNRLLALPVVGKTRQMDFFEYAPGEALTPNRFGIPEPLPGARFINGRSLDLLLVPLVAFDASGARLGMGAGYYDQYLARLGALRPRAIGVAHEVQRSPTPLPQAHWDIPLDGVITEAGWQARG